MNRASLGVDSANLGVERRQSQRNIVCFEILMSVGHSDTLIMQAVNKSETGLYVLSEGEKRPILGAKVKVSLNGYVVANVEPLNMLVTRMDRYGIGLQFLDS